jgi:hypothetical protein
MQRLANSQCVAASGETIAQDGLMLATPIWTFPEQMVGAAR